MNWNVLTKQSIGYIQSISGKARNGPSSSYTIEENHKWTLSEYKGRKGIKIEKVRNNIEITIRAIVDKTNEKAIEIG
jgi:hypothetical protein